MEVNQGSMLWNATVKKICGDLLLIVMICFRAYGMHLRRIQRDLWPQKDVSDGNDT